MPYDGRRLKVRGENLTWLPVNEEIIVLDLSTSRYLSVNGSGVVLWTALVEGATLPALVDLLIETYAIDRERAEADVSAFLESMEERKFLDGA